MKIKSISLEKLKNPNTKLICIVLFNVLDGLFTYIGVSHNQIIEVNKLMTDVFTNISKLLLFKLILPSILVFVIATVINIYDFSKMTIANFFVNVCFWVYFGVLLMHLFWIGRLFIGLI